MPNWCENLIKINGEPDNMKVLVDKFKEMEKNNSLVMESLLGTDDRPADYEEGGWYDYNCNKFGTKWDFKYDDAEIDVYDEQINIEVLTAWSPPTPFLQSLCEMYHVKALIHYHEPGIGFAGTEQF